MSSFDRFTDDAKRAVERARREAIDLRHGELGAEHLALALFHEDVEFAGELERLMGVDAGAVRVALEALVQGGDAKPKWWRALPFTPAARRVFECAFDEPGARERASIAPEHVLLGILAEGDEPIREALAAQGLAPQAVRESVADLRPLLERAGEAVDDEDWAEALRIDEEISRRSRSVYTLTIVAQLRHGAGALAEAEQAARSAIELDPSYHAAWTELALLLDETQRPDEAADCRAEAARLHGEPEGRSPGEMR